MDLRVLKTNPNFTQQNLVNISEKFFKKISDSKKRNNRKFDLKSIFMSALAMFSLKQPSLLGFDSYRKKDTPDVENLKTLFKLNEIPSDTHFRETLDKVEHESLLGIFQKYIDLLRETKALDCYKTMGNKVIVSIDGTGFFQSNTVHCDQCLQRKRTGGKISYEHHALPAVLIHPNIKEVLPIGLEMIQKQDGEIKNDCERNASKRLISRLRKDYPDLKMIIVEDSLSSNVPHVKELTDNGMSFILGIKPGDHKNFFKNISDMKSKKLMVNDSHKIETKSEIITYKFQYKNMVKLSSDEGMFYVNYFELEESKLNKKSGEIKVTYWSWITDIPINKNSIFDLMKCARARWKIENETFNTLKNKGYNFEHNYGHGEKNLANNMCIFMLLSFLIDQIQQKFCLVYKTILGLYHARKYFFEKMRSLFCIKQVSSFQEFYSILLQVSPNGKSYYIEFINSS